jgi:hypothetical protein
MTTEMQKWTRVETRWNAIVEFLGWLGEYHPPIRLTERTCSPMFDTFDRPIADYELTDELLPEHFDIDIDKLDAERKAMTERIKASYKGQIGQ